MPALQRTEALTRARLLDVHDYRLDLDLTRGEELFGCTTVIRFACAEPGSETFLDLRPVELLRAVLNGRPLDPAALADGRLTLPGLAAENELLVETVMRYSRTGEGLHRFTDPADGAVYVYANSSPDAAPRVFPCFDQPDLKARFGLSVSAPEQWTVIANCAGTQPEPGRWVFEPTRPISTYLVTLVGGPLHSVYSEHDGIPLGVHARRSLGAALEREAAELFEITAACFDRMHEVFDDRYPFGKYDQAFVPEFNWGAMENPGCVVIADKLVFHAPATEAQRENRAMGIAHEMAHMWFGDLVTMRWWDDLWLNESFAEYLGYRVATENTRFTGAWTTFGIRRKSWGYDADQRDTTHPIAATGVESLAEAMVNFDGIAYAKGASAVKQLVTWLGDKAFFAGINEYLARHRYGNADLADFLTALAGSSGRDVQGWADRWLGTTGVDTLRIEGGELIAEGSRPHRAGVGVYHAVGGALVPRERFELEVAPGGRAQLPVGVVGGALLLPNDGDLTWAKIRLDEASWRTVRSSLSTITDQLARAVLWEHARDRVRDAELTPAEYLELVADHLPREPVDAVVETVLLFARAVVVQTYLPPEERAGGHALLRQVCDRLLAWDGASESVRRVARQAAIENAVGEPALLWGWLSGSRSAGEAADEALEPELRWAVLTRLAASGEIDEERIAAELSCEPNDIAQQGAAAARGALPGAAAKERAWEQLFRGGLSNFLLAGTAQGFWLSGDAELQEAYVQRYFEELPGAGSRGDMVIRTLGQRLFPAGWSTARTVRLAEACLAVEGLTPATRRVLGDHLDDLRRAVRVRSAR
ncbi:aminopeptidase N [Kitasatospora sp. McL0602]|uniref:aminopeptidase N n=1 Tax=Kitasatospora sp. McL0602 TaxID=3439530 RepID=UPI003F88DF32